MPRSGRKFLQAALILGLGSIGSSGRVEAAFFVAESIIVDSTTLMSTPDPQFQYDFSLSLHALTQLERSQDPSVANDFITFHNISNFQAAQFNSPYANFFQIVVTPTTTGFSDVSLVYTNALNLANESLSAIPLGDFIVSTLYNYDPNNVPPILLAPIGYNEQGHDLQFPPNVITFSSTTTPHFVTPEPASLALFALGLPSALFLARRFRPVAS